MIRPLASLSPAITHARDPQGITTGNGDGIIHIHPTTKASAGKNATLGKFASAGFRFHDMSAKEIEREFGASPAALLARFSALADSTSHPPGPNETWLGETVIHSEDIRRPLSIPHTYPPDALKRVAEFYRGSQVLIGGKRRVEGLRLRATDVDWTAGEGPEVSGPILSIAQATAGRKAALDDLTGEGVDILRQRG